MKSMRRTVKKILLALVIAIALPIFIFFIHWGSSLVRCEILTEMKREVVEEYFASEEGKRILDCEVEYFKVLSAGKYRIRVYYIAKPNAFSGEITLLKGGTLVWVEDHNWPIWTNGGGSADNFVWPYWHHVFTRR